MEFVLNFKPQRGFIVCLLAIALIGCTAIPQPTSTPTATLPSATATSAPSATPPPTETPVPPTPTSQPTATPTEALSANLEGLPLIEAMRGGGFTVLIQHAATGPAQTDAATENILDCTTQRTLNDLGREEARAIGRAFFTLDIPVGQVFSGATCRARETALLAFGNTRITTELTGFPIELSEERVKSLRDLLSEPPAPGTNTVLVSDGANIADATGITLEEGESAIFFPEGSDGYALAARVTPQEWVDFEQVSARLSREELAEATDLLLPDLFSQTPSNLLILANSELGTKQLRFTTSIQNDGPGPIEIWGFSDDAVEVTTVVQHIYTVSGATKKVVVGDFIFHPTHDHWHLSNFARYELWTLNAEGGLETRVAVTDKVSYCLRDDSRSDNSDPNVKQTYMGCNAERQGISPGWVDVYRYELPGQELDISGLPDGTYVLVTHVDPDNLLWERDRENNATAAFIQIEGMRARFVD